MTASSEKGVAGTWVFVRQALSNSSTCECHTMLCSPRCAEAWAAEGALEMARARFGAQPCEVARLPRLAGRLSVPLVAPQQNCLTYLLLLWDAGVVCMDLGE
jgi:hypothetical protein